MLDQLRALFKKNYHIDNIDESTNLKNDLGLTSFDFINLIAILEDAFHIEFDEEKYHSINTIGDLIDYIESTGR